MADLLSSDVSSSGTDYAKTADSLLGTQKSSFTWQDVLRLAQSAKSANTNMGTLPGVSTFAGYKQNVPVAQIQPIPTVDEKKSDEGLDSLISMFAGGGSDFGGVSSSTGGGGAF